MRTWERSLLPVQMRSEYLIYTNMRSYQVQNKTLKYGYKQGLLYLGMIAGNSIMVINIVTADKKFNRRIDFLPVGENALSNYLWDYENRLLKYLLLLVILYCLPDPGEFSL